MKSKSIYFIHIPKTGGSSVNDFFVDRYGEANCLLHAENHLRSKSSDQLGAINEYSYIAAHQLYPNAAKRLDLESRFVFTILRDPLSQIVSHIAWVRFQAEPSRKSVLRTLPPHVQGLSARLADIDLSVPTDLDAFLGGLAPQELSYFDNCQTRYLSEWTHGHVGREQFDQAQEALRRIDFIGVTSRLNESLLCLSFLCGCPPPRREWRTNTSVDRFGLDPFNPLQEEILRPFVRFDQLLFDHGGTLFGGAMYHMLSELQNTEKKLIDFRKLRRVLERRSGSHKPWWWSIAGPRKE